ncbi:uncharacterized protein ACB058_017639 isoform 1-T1 [Synchiropus picturatus]
MEVSGGRHPGPADRTQRRGLFPAVPGLHHHAGVVPLAGVHRAQWSRGGRRPAGVRLSGAGAGPRRRELTGVCARTQVQREELRTLSLLLTPVSRIHSYLSHIQNLLQWTSKEHPDCSLLLGSERALRGLLSRCHVILEQDVRWEEGCESSGSEAAGGESAPTLCQRSRPGAREAEAVAQR